jgi:type IV pilus assembly protein PilC
VPILGKQLRKAFLVRYASMLSLSFQAGLDAASAFRLAGETTPDKAIKLASTFASLAAERGRPVSEALARYPKTFPHSFLTMYQTGEESGTLEELMLKQAQIWEDELRPATKALVKLASMIVLVVAMLFVGLQMVQGLNSSVKDTQKTIDELLK